MKRSLLTEWVRRLRFGGYRKTTGKLYSRAENAFCALGILRLAAGHDNPYMWNDDMDGNALGIDYHTSKAIANMNDGTKDIFKQWKTQEGTLYTIRGDQEYRRPLSFKEIADWIEDNVPVEEDEPVLQISITK